jgi:endoglucanase
LIVTHVDEKGFFRFTSVGGVNPATLVGGRVIFASGVRGVIGVERRDPPWDGVHLERLFIDVGAADKSAAEQLAAVGDVCAFDRPCEEVGTRLVAKAMDDRVCCAVLVQVIKELESTPHQVTFVFTTQEEVGVRGATTSAYSVDPEIALAVDVSPTGDTPEPRRLAVSLGSGPALMVKDSMMVAHAGLRAWLARLASREGIQCQMEILEQGSTDAKAMQITREGVIAGAVSVPTRYVHTPSEMVDLRDVRDTVLLLTAFLHDPVEL